MRLPGAACWLLALMFVAAAAGTPLALAQSDPPLTPTLDLTPPPPPPTPETPPDVSGTWQITRSWFRNCPGACDWPVIRGTTWNITQSGSEFRVDRGPRGTIRDGSARGYAVQLAGVESDGFQRFDFYYTGVYLSPDGTSMAGQFFGSETIQNPCGLANPIVTCFAQAGSFLAIRSSPPPQTPTATPTLPAPTATPTTPAAATATATATATASATATPTGTPTGTLDATPTRVSGTADHAGRRYLPLLVRPSSEPPL